MPRVDETYPDEWLKAHHLEEGDWTLTITSTDMTEFDSIKTGKKQAQIVLHFHEIEMALGLNQGNARTLHHVFNNPESDDWIGKKIVVGAAKSNSGTKYVEVREGPTKAANRKAAPPRQPAAAARPARPQQTAPAVTQQEVDENDEDVPF